jgi:hypothetical protein
MQPLPEGEIVLNQRPTIKQLRAACRRFNERYPLGTAVLVMHDGQEFRTKTRSEAFVLSGQAALQVEGVAGSYPLGQVRVVPLVGEYSGTNKKPAS